MMKRFVASVVMVLLGSACAPRVEVAGDSGVTGPQGPAPDPAVVAEVEERRCVVEYSTYGAWEIDAGEFVKHVKFTTHLCE